MFCDILGLLTFQQPPVLCCVCMDVEFLGLSLRNHEAFTEDQEVVPQRVVIG